MNALIICIISWTIAQAIKMIIAIAKAGSSKHHGQSISVMTFFASGGMPSSHSANVAALTTSILITAGYKSDLFAVCALFALITMFDSFNVRKAVGDLTERFNELTKDYTSAQKLDIEEVKVVEGHSLPQVIAGSALGVAVSLLFNTYVFV